MITVKKEVTLGDIIHTVILVIALLGFIIAGAFR